MDGWMDVVARGRAGRREGASPRSTHVGLPGVSLLLNIFWLADFVSTFFSHQVVHLAVSVSLCTLHVYTREKKVRAAI